MVDKGDYTNYGPLLTNNPISGKGSFIEANKSQLVVINQAPEINHIDQENPILENNLESSKSTYLLKSFLSGRNTTVSDKNSDKEKNQLKTETHNESCWNLNYQT